MAHNTSIIPYYSVTASNTPAPGSIQAGEIALNVADKKIFSSTDGTDVITLYSGVDGGIESLSEDLTPELSGNLAGNDKVVHQAALKDIGYSVNALGSVSGNTAIDYESGNVVTATATGSTDFNSITNAPPVIGFLRLFLTTPASGSISWTAVANWPGGTAPVLTASTVNIIDLVYDGSAWHGYLVSGNTS